MATLKQVAQAVSQLVANHALLIYGQPKCGKTRLVGTAAKLPEINKIYWFDMENGVETLLNMGLTDDELEKVVLIKIRDSRDQPVAIETVLKSFTSKVPVKICEAHGKIDCLECARAKAPYLLWHLGMCTHNDLVVLDSGSQLGDSALAAACLGKPGMYKPSFDEYGMVNKWLGDIMSVVQQANNTNFAVITHEIALEDDEGRDKIFPLMGSKPFSMRCAKFFGTVAYMHKKANKHVAGSSSTYRGDVLTGSRVNAMLEKAASPDMRSLLVDSGILRTVARPATESTSVPLTPVQQAPVATLQPVQQTAPKPALPPSTEVAADSLGATNSDQALPAPGAKLTLAEKLALKKKGLSY